jgi:hypothetical protein
VNASRRKAVAWIALSVLLFLQLAVSAYACTMSSPAAGSAVSAHCDGDRTQPSKLCEQHCLQGTQSVDTQPQAGPLSPVLPIIRIVGQSDVCVPVLREADRARLVLRFDPPPLVRFGVLRI